MKSFDEQQGVRRHFAGYLSPDNPAPHSSVLKNFKYLQILIAICYFRSLLIFLLKIILLRYLYKIKIYIAVKKIKIK